MKVIFHIDNEADLWDYNFKEEVMGSEDEFDKYFVLKGNRDYNTCEEAPWYKGAKGLLNDLDMDSYVGQVFRYYGNITREQRKAVLKVYEESRYLDDLETIVAVANILNPEREFKTATIRGICQSDWQDVAYDTKYERLLEYLEAWYFGEITEINCVCEETEEDCWGTMTDDEIWRYEREGNLKEKLLGYFGYKDADECEIYRSHGYTQVKKWEQIA